MDRETPCHLGRIGLHEKFLPFDLAPNILESTLDQVGVWLGSAIGKRERDVFFHDSLKSNEAAMKPSFWSRLLGFRIIQVRANTKQQARLSDWSPRDTFKVFSQWNTNGSWQSLDLPAGATTFHFQHTYAKTGKRHVTVQIIDDDLDFAATSFVLDIV